MEALLLESGAGDTGVNAPDLAVLVIALTPLHPCTFSATPGRSVHAALLRRLELVAPALSQALHDAPAGDPISDHPRTVSSLLGPMDRSAEGLVARSGQTYGLRITSLEAEMAEALQVAFDPEHPLGREPLVLEHVPFTIEWGGCNWERLTTCANLLTSATPHRTMRLEFRSPTGFRSARGILPPTSRLCLQSYIRKWNRFSGLPMPEESLLSYAENHIDEVQAVLRSAAVRFKHHMERGVVGWVEWSARGGSPVLLRLMNALMDYAEYCGTGMKTAQGMGQTRRLLLHK